jgi:tetratricopeptide (TPR) repeat protein
MQNPLASLLRRAVLPNVLAAAAAALIFTSTGRCETAEELIEKGDLCSAKFQSSEGLKCYLPAEKLDPKNAQLLVRISKQYRHLMSDAAKSDEKVRLGSTALSYAQRAVSLAPNDPEAHLALAISYGKLTPLLGNKEQFNNSPLIKAAAEKSIALDPSNDLAWQVLGRWYLAVADIGSFKRAMARMAYGSLPTATYEDAVRCFQKAIVLNPARLMHHIELGRVYAQMGRTAEAKKCITKGLALPETEKDDAETKRNGRLLLAKLR